MADEPNATGEPQAGDPVPINSPQPQAGNPEPQAGDGSTEPISLEAAKKLRSENASLRKRTQENDALLAELKAFKEQAEAAQLSESEKRDRAAQQREKQFADLQKAHDDALRAHQEYKINAEVRLQAAQMGFADLSDAVRLLDWSEIEYDDDGTPKNVRDLLGKLLKAKPYLAGKSAASAVTGGGATAPARSTTSGPQTLTKEYVAQIQRGGQQAWAALSPEEQQRISAFIRAGGLFKR